MVEGDFASSLTGWITFQMRQKGNKLLCKQNSCQRDIDVLVYLLSRQLLGSDERSSKASILVDQLSAPTPPQSPFNPFSPENGHIQITGKVLVALMDASRTDFQGTAGEHTLMFHFQGGSSEFRCSRQGKSFRPNEGRQLRRLPFQSVGSFRTNQIISCVC